MCSEYRLGEFSEWLREVLRLERAHAFCMVHCLEAAPLLLMCFSFPGSPKRLASGSGLHS